ncbi:MULTISPECIES: hypothetical protein [Halorussus]|uniref:DUF5789 family protein n=1 Tax=Halorussus TaxID=1070314 RepID=UPI000E210A04|nr:MULTISPECIES: hypothetical protein [Halorussus]NHN60681.1 hypothetical protein [Halorussus sp. JP-T4]
MSGDPDPEREQRHARERQRERTERVEDMLGEAGEMLGEHKYPATSEELATEYGDQPLDLQNETESLGSVFDRLVDERFDSADEAREAVYDEISGEAGGPEEYNDQRDLAELDAEAADEESNVNSN